MGNALVCFEHGSWDSHGHVNARYKPGPEPQQDMTQPLSHYFISSGHNSYLEGNQLTSNAGTRTIEIGLKLGCRVIELDVYDGPNGQPICTHGGTLTSKVTFRDCVKIIGKHAFSTSPYPVILTIENHADTQQQATMAQELRRILGEHLFVPEPEQLAKDGEWLSPEALKHKVLIRAKVKEGETAPELAQLVYICNSKISGYDVKAGPAVPSSHSLPDSKLPDIPEYEGMIRVTSSGGDKSGAQSFAGTFKSSYGDIKAALKSAKSGSGGGAASAAAGDSSPQQSGAATDTVVGKHAVTEHRAGKSAKDKAALAAAAAHEQVLAAEKDDTVTFGDGAVPPEAAEAARAAEEEAAGAASLPASLSSAPLSKVFGYTSRHLLRCYPSGWRMLDNSNPNPMHTWSLGGSLAALNWQLWDEPIWTNNAFFSRFNHSGYILKPEWMTTSIPSSGLPAQRSPRVLSATVYSAHRFQGKNFGIRKDDPYVELKVRGLPCDSSSVRTEHVNDSGRLVVDKNFQLSVTFPELAVLVVLLKDLNVGTADVVLGYAALPLATLTEGEYKLQLAEPYVCSEHPKESHDMWVKLKLEWLTEEQAAAAAKAATAAAKATVAETHVSLAAATVEGQQ